MLETTLGHRETGGQPGRPSTTMKKREHKALEGDLRNEHYRAIAPVNQLIAETEQEVAVAAARIGEIEALMTDPAHYEDSQNVIAVNCEYANLGERVARLTAEWDGLTAEAEGLKLEYRRAREDLAG